MGPIDSAMRSTAVNLQQNVQLSLMKKSMDSSEIAMQEMLLMLPPTPGMGQYVDTYA